MRTPQDHGPPAGRDCGHHMGRNSRRDPRPVIAFILLILAYETFVELRYAFLGKAGRAVVVQENRYIQHSRHGSRTPMVSVMYRFGESNGAVRTESDDVPDDGSQPSVGQTIDIEYCPGDAGVSRLAGHTHVLMIGMLLILISGGLVGVTIYYALPRTPLPVGGSGMFDVMGNQ